MNTADLIKANAKRWDDMIINSSDLPHIQKIAAALSTSIAAERYREVEAATKVPWKVVAVIHEREASQSWTASLAQGDPWNKVSIHTPRGIGPFASWAEAAIYAMQKTGPRVANWTDWSTGGTLTLLEQYNGLGYFNRGLPSPYIWAGTNQYSAGKFIADGHFDPAAVDKQVGCAALLKLLSDPKVVVEAKPAQPTQEPSMNPISMMMTAFTLAQAFAPLVPTVVGDVKTFANDMEKVIADLKKMDGSATMNDISALFADLQSDLPMVTNVLAASKGLKL